MSNLLNKRTKLFTFYANYNKKKHLVQFYPNYKLFIKG